MAISESLRAKLLQQKEDRGFTPNDRLIDNKTVTEEGIVVRLLPSSENDPSLGEEFKSFYCSSLNTGTTSPFSFGKDCPILEALDNIWQSDDNELKEHAKNFVNTQREIWIPVILRGVEDESRIRILRCKSSIYNQLIEWVMEDRLEPLHDPQNGCDLLIKKEGKGLTTKWSIDRLGQAPLFEDAEMVAEVVKNAHSFEVRNSFFNFNLEKIEQIYEGLTGDDLPTRFHEDLDGFNPRTVDSSESTEATPVSKDLDDLLDRPAPDTSTKCPVGASCTFEDDDGEPVSGKVLGVDEEDDGNWLVVEDDGDEEEPWSIPSTEVTVAKPKRKVRKPSRKASSTIRQRASKS